MVPRAPITTGTVVVLSLHIRSTSISKSLYLVSCSMVLTEVLVSRGIITLITGCLTEGGCVVSGRLMEVY